MIKTLVLLIAILCGLAETASAEVYRVPPDGDFRFAASADGPTRISVRGQRIARIIQSDSQFEMVNDANTGDVFLRFVGESLKPESGHLVTEGGHTIGFTMEPKRGLGTQTVLIDLVGVQSPKQASAAKAAETKSSGFEITDGGSTGYEASLAKVVRGAIEARIGLKSAASYKAGANLGVYSKGGLRARVMVAGGARPRPQSYYSNRTVAVWVDDVTTKSRTFVVIVEKK